MSAIAISARLSILPPSPFCTGRSGPGALARSPDGVSVAGLPEICDGVDDTETAFPSRTLVQLVSSTATPAAIATAVTKRFMSLPPLVAVLFAAEDPGAE